MKKNHIKQWDLKAYSFAFAVEPRLVTKITVLNDVDQSELLCKFKRERQFLSENYKNAFL